MENKKMKFLLWATLVALVLIAIPTSVRLMPDTVGKRFVDSHEFQGEMNLFYQTLSTTVLNPIKVEEVKERITITKEEIEEHRRRYGNLSDQIQNIQSQYEDQLSEAEETGNDRVKESLIKERDQKIADIELNFESDEHVKEKIITEKLNVLKEFIANTQQYTWNNFPVAYELTDIETGETFSRGKLETSTFYKVDFNETSPFKAYSIREEGNEWIGESSETTLRRQEVANPVREFSGTVLVPQEAVKEGYLKHELAEFKSKQYRHYTLWILAIVSLVLLFTKVKFKKEWLQANPLISRYETLKIDMKVFVFIVVLFFIVEIIMPNVISRFFYDDIYRGAWINQLFWFVLLTGGIMWLTIQLVLFVERWKIVGQLEKDLVNSYTVQFLKAIRNMFLNRTLGIQLFILLVGFFLAGIGFVIVLVAPVTLLVYFPAVIFLGLPAMYLFVRYAAYLNEIFVSTEKIAQGTLNEEISIKGKSPLAKHAEHLNQLREGVQISMNEQAKSERLKTELITNVSHDLRTPLTSIITYTDLLKSENLGTADRLKYAAILDKKSARLKVLIEDLFEVSKMASGNIELHKKKVDLSQLLQQALAEHEEEMNNTDLDFRIQLPEQAVIAYVDGQRWWRVLDNLIINTLKYSMPGTRVYLTLEQLESKARFVVKNVSKYELNENSDELFERFKRADTSRHTDGSGLGLAIAQSIVDLHGGEMKIEIDGDLFKVTVDLSTR